MTTHTLTIHLYANLKEKAGSGLLQLEVPEGCTVESLKARLKQKYPAIATQLNKVMLTVNGGQVILNEEVVPRNAEVTILPPFGGG